MIHGIDTTFLVQLEADKHPDHRTSKALLNRLLTAGDTFALAPQVLAEFIHVITDGKRFEHPLTALQATDRANIWWNANETIQVFPNADAMLTFFSWMKNHRLGRKRILDTQLAATYYQAGIRSILSTNARDYSVYACFTVLDH